MPGPVPFKTSELNGHKPEHRKIFNAKNEFIATSGEFVGTFMFLMLAFGGTSFANLLSPTDPVSGEPNLTRCFYIAASFGLSLAVNVWAFFRVTGGLFNPVVCLALALVGGIPWLRAVLLSLSQVLAAMCAAAVVDVLTPGKLTVRTTLAPGTSISRGLFIEMFMTAQLVFVILMLAAEKHKATFMAPIGIGLALFIIELWGVYYTGGSVNPARSFGPCVATKTFEGYHWIYWLGPVLGSLIATGFYKFIKYLEYETVVPGQDAATETEADKKEKEIERALSNSEQGDSQTTAHDAHEGGVERRGDGARMPEGHDLV
ncbi:Aquaporin-1 [Saitoella coloradoensis]